MNNDFLSEKNRAEDILLGSLGFGEEAQLVSIEIIPGGYKGIAKWSNGEKFPFVCEEEIDELQQWALKVLSDFK
jgi:hypothetical protein